jgi:hypothetical protein
MHNIWYLSEMKRASTVKTISLLAKDTRLGLGFGDMGSYLSMSNPTAYGISSLIAGLCDEQASQTFLNSYMSLY